jgi:hypothetical protein
VAGGIGSISWGKLCTAYIPTNNVDIFNETAGTFTPTNGLNRSLAYHYMTLLSTGRALESGGITPQTICCVVTSDSEVYTPLTLTFSASSLDFGRLPIGSMSPPQTATVTNVSGHPVSFTSITASGDYAQTNTCPASLSFRQSCTITATFTSTSQGTRTGAVTLKDNSLGSPSQTTALKGVGED